MPWGGSDDHRDIAEHCAAGFPFLGGAGGDDASSDSCESVVSSFAEDQKNTSPEQRSRIKVIRSQQAQGLPASRNIGVQASRGVWICALSAGDRLGSGHLRAASASMSHQPGLQLLHPGRKSSSSASKLRHRKSGKKALGQVDQPEIF
eukprot:CAMPEP_0115324858 /NCGR_PEP_ID=MMETSP0270-20121206/82702_1 /TAXON_ID=71861 /ORGANISM="Scrippsiella trochoidea, Strain CCMP3099" /LENGTH=147 /DNA_ID=CAMNT_0002745003 /DNA_START=132 /DNA_END=573 /DNA_ORIENTATION=+